MTPRFASLLNEVGKRGLVVVDLAAEVRGLAICFDSDHDLTDAACRLMRLLDRPDSIPRLKRSG